MMSKFKQSLRHPMFKHFMLYSFIYVVFGALLMGFGPLIPYYAQRDHRLQSSYSIVLLARLIGSLLGVVSVKLVEKYLTIHQCLAIGLLIAGVFAIVFSYVTNIYVMSVMFGISAFGAVYLDIFCNVGTIQAFKTGDIEKWLQFLHACMGIGGLLVPFVVYTINYHTYMALGVLSIICAIVVLFIKSPQIINSETEAELNKEDREQVIQSNFVSFRTLFFLGLSVYMITGIETTFGSWISTYAVKTKIATKEGATLYSSLYWISITVFRLGFIFLGGKPSIKIGLLTFLGFLSSLFSLFYIVNIDAHIGALMSTILIGFCGSAVLALIIGISNEFGISFLPSQVSTLMLFANVSEGTLAVVVGLLFTVLPLEILYVSVAFCFLWMFLNNINVMLMLSRDKQESPLQDSGTLSISQGIQTLKKPD